MTMILLAAALLAAQPAPAPAQPSTHSQSEAPKADLVPVTIETSLGRIVVALDRGRGPITAANFLRYVDTKRFDGQAFYRAMKNGPEGGLVQGGVTTDARKLLPPIAHEPTSRTGLKHVAGALSMARLTPGSAKADFFILTTDIPGFDAGAPGGDADGFAVFGQVVEGMDVVRAIYAAPTSPTKGEGVMKGQMLDPPVKIIKAARVEEGASKSGGDR